MTKLFLAAGVAALAIAAPVSAKPEKGGGGGEHKAHVAKAERGGGKAAKIERRGGEQRVVMQDKAKGREFKAVSKAKGDDRRIVKLDRKDRDLKIADRLDRRDIRAGNWDGDEWRAESGEETSPVIPAANRAE